jgi:hypothetical protein
MGCRWSKWLGKHLRHALQLEDGLDGTGVYFPATVIEDLWSPCARQRPGFSLRAGRLLMQLIFVDHTPAILLSDAPAGELHSPYGLSPFPSGSDYTM